MESNGTQLYFAYCPAVIMALNLLSDLYALSDFSPRKSEKIQKGYMVGRYGAIPNIGGVEW